MQSDERRAEATEELNVADPFAGDLFAASRAAVAKGELARDVEMTPTDETREEEREVSDQARRRAWHLSLPQVTRDDVRRSAMLAQVPASLGSEYLRAITEVIARSTHTASRDVSLALIDLCEMALLPSPPTPQGESVRALLSIEPRAALLAAELDAGFARSLVDRMLGGDGAAARRTALRSLETTELAVTEFLWLSLVSRLNDEIGEPLLTLRSVMTGEASDPLTVNPETVEAAPPRRALVATVRIAVEATRGLLRLRLDENALASLSSRQNPLLKGTGRQRLMERMRRVMPEAPLAVRIGRTTVTRAEISHLEYGDVILVKQQDARWQQGELGARLHVRVGEGHNVMLFGEQTDAEQASAMGETAAFDKTRTGDGIRLQIGVIGGGYAPTESERLKMEEATNDELTSETTNEEEAGTALDNLMLTLHVELPARRIRLDELASLRANQIINLGCLPTDPVELVADGRRLARGELVDVEGRLGVRILEVFDLH